MITRRKEASELLQQYQKIFDRVMNKPVTIKFDMHKLEDVIVTGLALAKTTGMKNAPNKRITDDGKNKSPLLFEVQTADGNLQFAFDDTQVSPLTDGVRLTIPLKRSTKDKLEIDMRLQ